MILTISRIGIDLLPKQNIQLTKLKGKVNAGTPNGVKNDTVAPWTITVNMTPMTVYIKAENLFICMNIPPRAIPVRTPLNPHNPEYIYACFAPSPIAVMVLTILPMRAKAADIGEQIKMPTSIKIPVTTFS